MVASGHDLYMKKKLDCHETYCLRPLRKNDALRFLSNTTYIGLYRPDISSTTSETMLMKSTVLSLIAVVCLARAQRPPYAGSSNRYPAVLPQFIQNQNPAAASADTNQVVNRIDVDGLAATPVTSTIPPNLPIEAGGDYELIKRIMTWPRENQPFWFINWYQIQEHIGDGPNSAQQAQLQPNSRPSFAG